MDLTSEFIIAGEEILLFFDKGFRQVKVLAMGASSIQFHLLTWPPRDVRDNAINVLASVGPGSRPICFPSGPILGVWPFDYLFSHDLSFSVIDARSIIFLFATKDSLSFGRCSTAASGDSQDFR
jgi:hypothetical protein